MQWVPSPHRPGMVGVACGELARFVDFWACYEKALVPYGTIGIVERSYDAAYNYNKLMQAAVDERVAWLWILNDDHVFHPDLLMKLLSRDVDVIAPLCALRTPPFQPVVFRDIDGEAKKTVMRDVKSTGLDKSIRMGCAGLLIRQPVIEKIDAPWFQPGEIQPGRMMEDINFSQKIVDHGFTINVDCDNRIGHISIVTVWPNPPDGVEFVFDSNRTGIKYEVQ